MHEQEERRGLVIKHSITAINVGVQNYVVLMKSSWGDFYNIKMDRLEMDFWKLLKMSVSGVLWVQQSRSKTYSVI